MEYTQIIRQVYTSELAGRHPDHPRPITQLVPDGWSPTRTTSSLSGQPRSFTSARLWPAEATRIAMAVYATMIRDDPDSRARLRVTPEQALNFGRSLGKEAVAAKDNSGFIVNLLLVPYLLDAIRALERGVGSTSDIDNAMKLGCGYPMGPFTLLDFVGNDTTYKIAEIMFDEYRETRYSAPPLLKRMVLAGMYGRKSGKGFYDYSMNPPTVVDLGL